jgi:hypothetical protein
MPPPMMATFFEFTGILRVYMARRLRGSDRLLSRRGFYVFSGTG